MPALHADDFPTFYQEVHGRSAFPWQCDLVREILKQGSWPTLVDVPTGLGKTTLLDIAVFINALDADAPSDRRLGRRRIFFVVDRRIVVDQADLHARHLAERLEAAPLGTITAEIVRRLRAMVGPSATAGALPVVKMRGGVTWDASWLARPDQPGIVTGTVDQVGSRLFFRGYGVSPRRWPIDAALVGTDSLILVDEAHLATALTTTLATAQSYDAAIDGVGVLPSVMVQLTATSRGTETGWVPKFDEEAHLSDRVAAERLQASKTLRLTNATKATSVKVTAEAAKAEASQPGARVLVVCNTIDRARAVHSELTKLLPDGVPALLLIGRSRQYDREAVVSQALELFGADRIPSSTSAVLVATQTVEVGIDLDATGLVTESASWDALVQRIGRVNRRGRFDRAEVLVVHDDDPKPAVYGPARGFTAEFVEGLVGVDGQADVSPLAIRQLTPPAKVFSSQPRVPLLLPAHLDAWTRTGPVPANDVPLDPYLHGFDAGVAPVSLAWRDGLTDSDGEPVSELEANLAIDTIPVRSEECVEVPLSAVRRWLMDEKPMPVSDWDEDEDWDIPFGGENSRSVLHREVDSDGLTRWRWVSASSLRPGELVIVPTSRGGLDQFGWSPATKTPVVDVAEVAALDRGQVILRIDDGLPGRLGLAPTAQLWDEVRDWQVAEDPETKAGLARACERLVRDWLDGSEVMADSPWARATVDGEVRLSRLKREMSFAEMQAAAPPRRSSVRLRDEFLQPIAIMRSIGGFVPWQEASEDREDGTVHLLQQVTLAKHSEAVRRRAKEIADLLVPAELAGVIADAAGWHDLGKCDPRFQAMLFEGDPIRAAVASEPLAKSGMPPGDLQRHREARQRSKLPPRARHEAWSHALVASHLASLDQPYPGDPELLLHLVASHHGHARPLLPPVLDSADHQLVAEIDGSLAVADLPHQVDVGHADRFQALNRRYGRWNLALLEAIVRCADMSVSGEGS